MSQLSAPKQASLAAAGEAAELFAANPTTDAIQDSLIASVLQTGSLAGMLQHKAGPLSHGGYTLPPFLHKVDLAWFNMSPAEAQGYSYGLLQRIEAANARLFGPQPSPPQRPVLIQNLFEPVVLRLGCCQAGVCRTISPGAGHDSSSNRRRALLPAQRHQGSTGNGAWRPAGSRQGCRGHSCTGWHCRGPRAAAAGDHHGTGCRCCSGTQCRCAAGGPQQQQGGWWQ